MNFIVSHLTDEVSLFNVATKFAGGSAVKADFPWA
jgi:hypothetical protein